jgi:hypothetical protein
MIEQLHRLTSDIASLQSKLILLLGPQRSDKSRALAALGQRVGAKVLNVGLVLSARLASLPQRQRSLTTVSALQELADEYALGDLLLLDNIELLFDRTLQLDPLDLLKRHAHALRVVVVWPGDLREGRLTYAEIGHPEHQEYGLEGLVPFKVQ